MPVRGVRGGRVRDDEHPRAVKPSGVGLAALVSGIAGVVMPYFAQVFLVPTAFFMGLIAYSRGDKRYGTWALALSAGGLAVLVYNASRVRGGGK